MPVVIYFSTVISILYYLGVMQIVILKIAWVMQMTMGTTPAESVNAAGNIFIGQVGLHTPINGGHADVYICMPINPAVNISLC